MKIYVTEDDLPSFYDAETPAFLGRGHEVTMSNEDWADFQATMAKFREWQQRLSGLIRPGKNMGD